MTKVNFTCLWNVVIDSRDQHLLMGVGNQDGMLGVKTAASRTFQQQTHTYQRQTVTAWRTRKQLLQEKHYVVTNILTALLFVNLLNYMTV